MKKIISITIALCLLFASVLPVYAEAWTSDQAHNVTSGVAQILAQLLQLNSKFGNIDGSGRGVFDNILLELEHLSGWLVPDGARGSSDPTMMDNLVVLVTYAMNHLPQISSIAGYVSSWMNSNNNNLVELRKSLTNYQIGGTYDIWYWRRNFHQQLALDQANGIYRIPKIGNNGQQGSDINAYIWGGSPLGNIALILWHLNQNLVTQYTNVWSAALTDYTGQLGIWDSQGDTLTQEAWSPTSAINGLYKYLAYTQRDVARLTYVLASDEEIETREKARETQTAVMDDFIDPEGSAAASTDNFGEIASGSANVQQNFSTGYSISNMWGAFGSEHYGWFSQECADALDTSNSSTSGNRLLKNDKHDESDYDTPLLDEYYKQILSLGGGNDD